MAISTHITLCGGCNTPLTYKHIPNQDTRTITYTVSTLVCIDCILSSPVRPLDIDTFSITIGGGQGE